MNKEAKFTKWAFLLTPWFCALVTVILYTCLRLMTGDYDQSNTKFKKLTDTFGGISALLMFVWLASIFFTILYLLHFLNTKKTRSRWKDLLLLLCGHVVYWITFTSEILDIYIE